MTAWCPVCVAVESANILVCGMLGLSLACLCIDLAWSHLVGTTPVLVCVGGPRPFRFVACFAFRIYRSLFLFPFSRK